VTPLETIAPAVTCSVQVELQYLTQLDVDFDVTVTAFELSEIDLLFGELLNADENDPADAVVEVQSLPAQAN
jgi:hypothetical protein